MTFDPVKDARVRSAAFEWLTDQVMRHGEVLPHALLSAGFGLDGMRVPLLGPQGIFKPRTLSEAPLSIMTAPSRPYDDSLGSDGLLRYRYRGTDPNHPDNRGLRFAMEHRLPLIYLHGIGPGKYVAAWPVFVVADDASSLTFSIAVDDAAYLGIESRLDVGRVSDEAETARRVYVTRATRFRVHQEAFRERVLEAYRRQCAFCRLRHDELLNAAHIIPDTHPEGEPHVRNGLALCTLHHAAFDSNFVGLRTDHVLEVRPDILREKDGPTLVHAIQSLHGKLIDVPRREALRPAHDLVEMRYKQFLSNG